MQLKAYFVFACKLIEMIQTKGQESSKSNNFGF